MRSSVLIPVLFIAVAAISGCGPAPADDAVAEPGGPNFQLTGGHHDIMLWVLEPPADVIWDSAGFVITEAGEVDLSPTDDEGWLKVEGSALALAEGANLLLLPGRSAGPDWDEYTGGLIDASRLALDAARAQDADALFAAGGRIYQVCRACHQQYWVDQEAELE